MASLARVMPNVGGPRSRKREVSVGVVHTIMLYGAPAWHLGMGIKRYEKMMVSLQRQALLRVASAYRTVS